MLERDRNETGTRPKLENISSDDFEARAKLEAELVILRPTLKFQLDRDADPVWRKRYEIDKWRAENPEERNAARRTVREVPNMMTLKAVLETETEEEKKARLTAQDNCRKAKRRATRTTEQIDAERAKDAKRKSRAKNSTTTPIN